MKYLRLLLFPFSLIYGLVVSIRNWCFDTGIFKSRKFYTPIISVGNLDVGGAGKSPMTEYLVRLLKDKYKLATLSRGYGRKTKGYFVASKHAPRSLASLVGDEPGQFHQKFPDITVAVCEDRVIGIKTLQVDHSLIILDDAYQHRTVKPGFSLLLFDYNRVNEPHLLLPAGNLREPFSGRKRADVIIITKCPGQLSTQEQTIVLDRIKPFTHQQVFFTSINYQSLQTLKGDIADIKLTADTTVFLLTGIANANPLVQHLKRFTQQIIHHKYPDHHRFSLKNISKLADDFAACAQSHKVIVTTEKDAQRLATNELLSVIKDLPVLVLPIGISFLNSGQQAFDQLVLNYVTEYTKHHQLH
ncbi:tetraacyldisaccharide 4'-kinase [Mucilaginibacter sp. E4BP6]|uniref:tetraacyldisaccharide 4'-kinase n=1 Tax=Mucilaginibacter sp. E4BP6 TaxID=2723089 RepID=UPI0015C87420|nr:tetraacyldisaccharide 4'-kinase [Mucilaginibacter sp. E4BP6]NYE65391.1 tetraacyldisaccharide 4'-kinase [Mucilaginibacter sp. E4BP6]